jgi:hypothetical protein
MSCQQHVGILDENGKLTKEAKNSFISQVLLILEYGTDNIPEALKPPIPFPDKIAPSPVFKDLIRRNPNFLKDEVVYSSFYETWIARYEKLANDYNLKPNYSLLPAIADPIALGKDAFNVDLPLIDFPGGFIQYLTGLLPIKMIGDLIDAGEVKFLAPDGPAKLLKTLLEKNLPPPPAIPKPPIIVPPLPPLGFSLPNIPDSLPKFELTPEQIIANAPKPPEVIFSFLAAKEFAAFQNLPKVLSETVSKVPNFISKIGNPIEIVSEIAGIIKKSGMLGPEPNEFAVLERASSSVLAVKIAEMNLVATLALTIGSAPGSMTTSITQITSAKEPAAKYRPVVIERKQPLEKEELRPSEKAHSYAVGLKNSYYGNAEHASERTRYLQGLFYTEHLFQSFPDNFLNVFGEPVTNPENAIKFDVGPKRLLSEISQDIQVLEATPVHDKTGFFREAENNSGNLSSCGMFVRSCLRAGGALNRFFLSTFSSDEGTVRIGLNIGLMRNFRWVSKGCKSPNYEYNFENPTGGRGIINDLYDVTIDEKTKQPIITPRVETTVIPGTGLTVKQLKEKLEKYAGEKCRYNLGSGAEMKTSKDSGRMALHVGEMLATDAFNEDWSLKADQANIVPSENLQFLKPYLKPRQERAILSGFDIGIMLRNNNSEELGFPSLSKGDAVLIVRTANPGPNTYGKTSDWAINGEHVLLVDVDRKAGYDYKPFKQGGPKFDTLSYSIQAIEGGSIDDYNSKYVEKEEKFIKSDNEETNKKIRENIGYQLRIRKKFSNNVATQVSADEIKGYQASFDGLNAGDNITISFAKEVGKPSAILENVYDLGLFRHYNKKYISNNFDGDDGFFIGCSKLPQASTINSKDGIVISPNERRIIAIYKTDNYCNKEENSGPLAAIAADYMDEISVNSSKNFKRIKRVYNPFGPYVFPNYCRPYKESEKNESEKNKDTLS